MTPEERFNDQIRWALKRIKEESLATETSKPVRFEVSKIVGTGIPAQERQKSLIHKLAEWKAIKITYETDPSGGGISRYLFELELLQPKFNEIYEKYCGAPFKTVYIDNPYESVVNKLVSNEPIKSDNIAQLQTEIRKRSIRSLERILDVVEKLESVTETSSSKEPIKFDPATHLGSDGYDERDIVRLLEEWEILEFEVDDLFGTYFITTSLELLRFVKGEVENALNEVEEAGKKIVSPIIDSTQKSLESFANMAKPLNDSMKRTVDTLSLRPPDSEETQKLIEEVVLEQKQKAPTYGWELKKREKWLYLFHNGVEVAKICTAKSNKGVYLLYLFDRFEEAVEYKELYQETSRHNYPAQGLRTKPNKNIRSEIIGVRNIISEAAKNKGFDEAPYIEIDKGFKLFVKKLPSE